MVSIVLFISFILHFVTLFIILLLFLKWNKVKQIEAEQNNMRREIEEIFSAYLLELKEENEKFTQIANEITRGRNYGQPQKQNREVTFTDRSSNQDDMKDVIDGPPISEYVPPTPEFKEVYDQSFPSQVLELHNNGYTVNEIAQKLNKGKTEIELVLKFHQS